MNLAQFAVRFKRFVVFSGILCLLLIVAYNAFSQAANTFNSFETFKIGLVVQDTSSLHSSYEQPFYDHFDRSGMSVYKIDTTSMDAKYFDSRAWPWDTLDAVVICFGTDSAAIDTSIAQGIGDVPLLVMEPGYWLELVRSDSDGIVIDDSFYVTAGSDWTLEAWSTGIFPMLTTDDTAYYHSNGSLGTWNLRDQDNTNHTNIVAPDSFYGVQRYTWGLVDGSTYSHDAFEMWTFFDRHMARLFEANHDSTFTFGMTVQTDGQIDSDDEDAIKGRLEMNAHLVYAVDTDSLNGLDPSSGVSWSDLDGFLHVRQDNSSSGIDSVLDNISSILVGSNSATGSGVGADFLDSLNLADGTDYVTVPLDSVVVQNIAFTVLSEYSVGDTLNLLGDATSVVVADPAASGVFNLLSIIQDGSEINIDDNSAMAVKSDAKHIYAPGFDHADFEQFTTDGWLVFDKILGWMFDTSPTPATNVTITALSTDSVTIGWDDNNGSEEGYSIFIYDPDSTYWAHLAADVVLDTLFHLWPPNSRVIADVAVVSGTDTVFSATGPDTAYSLAAVPPTMFQKVLTDTSIAIFLNGYLLDERFDDEDLTADPVWTTKFTGVAEIDTVKRQGRSFPGTTSAVYSTPFASLGDSINDAEWMVHFKFSDSAGANIANQLVGLYLMAHSDSCFDSSGYKIVYEGASDKIKIRLLRLSTAGAETTIGEDTTSVGSQDLFKWHDSRIVRDITLTPQDTTVNWTVYVDSESLFTVQDSTYLNTDYFGFQLGPEKDIRIDNLQIRQLRPSGNHDSTHYAIQDSVSGLYVHDASDTLRASENWRTYSEWGSANGDTVTSLPADSSHRFRSKARSGRS